MKYIRSVVCYKAGSKSSYTPSESFELRPSCRYIVEQSRKLGLEVIDRCNLTVLLEPEQEGLVQFLAANKVGPYTID